MLSRQEMASLSPVLEMTADMIAGRFDAGNFPASAPRVASRAARGRPAKNRAELLRFEPTIPDNHLVD